MPARLLRARPTAVVGALFLLGACDAGGPQYAVSVRTAANAAPATLAVGDTLALVAEARATTPYAGFSPPAHPFAWRSSDGRVAEVTAAGLVRARAPGAVTISVDYGGQRATLALVVGGE
jgi:hypothetical protein